MYNLGLAGRTAVPELYPGPIGHRDGRSAGVRLAEEEDLTVMSDSDSGVSCGGIIREGDGTGAVFLQDLCVGSRCAVDELDSIATGLRSQRDLGLIGRGIVVEDEIPTSAVGRAAGWICSHDKDVGVRGSGLVIEVRASRVVVALIEVDRGICG